MITFTIPVNPVTKKNTPQIIPNKGKGRPFFLLPSKQYLAFEKDCLPYLLRVKREHGVIDYPVNMECVFYTETKRRVDLANLLNAVDDAMVKAELIQDDNRDIIAGHDNSRVFYDKFNPRIEVKITELKDYNQWNNTKDKQLKIGD